MLKKIKDEKKKTSRVKNTSTKFNGKNKKIVLGVSVLLIVLIVLLTTFLVKVNDKVVITIDNIQYTEKDFNMYAYLVKYEYFGIYGTNVSDNTLNTQVSNDSDITIGEYLKEQTVSKIKISASILRIAEENNVTLTKEDLKDFHKIMIETGKRDGFIIRPLEYFEKMYDCMGPEHMKILMAYHDGKPISGVIPIFYGNKTWYLYGASSNQHRNLMPNYLLQWEMIKMAIARKDDVYDFRGVSGVVDENHPQYGLYRFKQGFGATFTEFIGEIYIPFKPITYKLYRFSEKAFRTLRQLKRKIFSK